MVALVVLGFLVASLLVAVLFGLCARERGAEMFRRPMLPSPESHVNRVRDRTPQ